MAGSVPKSFATRSTRLLVLHVPHGGNHQVVPPVALLEELQNLCALECVDGVPRPEDGHAQGVPLPEMLLEDVVDVLVGRVLHHADLLEDDGFLLVDVIEVEQRVDEDVGQQVDGQREVVVGHLDVERRQLLAGEGVHHAPDGIDVGGDVKGRPPGRPLEEHVLDEVGRPVDPLVLVARAAGNPGADRDGADVTDLFRDDLDPVRKDCFSVRLQLLHPGHPSCSGGSSRSSRSR